MESNLPPKQELRLQAAEGRPITQAEASTLAAEETDRTGVGPVKGGPAATAQSLHDKQQRFIEVAGEVARKPSDEVTKQDAAVVQKAEARFLGGPPGKGSTSADVQSVADRNVNKKGEEEV